MRYNGDVAEYAVLTFVSLFAIVDPFAAVPAFLAMTPRNSVEQKRRMALVASIIAGIMLAAFAAGGQRIFRLFGITLPAFQVAGGLILLLAALDMLRAKRSSLKETAEETQEGAAKDDIAVTPLAIPMLAGPGSITTVIVLAGKASDLRHKAVLFACIAAVSVVSFLVLFVAAAGSRRLSPILLNIMERLMGLLLATIGVQFILSALGLV